MTIRYATEKDIELLARNDKWVSEEILREKVNQNKIFVAFDGGHFIGWLRYGLFWDNIPFMYMLHLTGEYRGNGFGRKLVEYWENEMKQLGYKVVATSTAQTETAQHFYGKLGYKAAGSFQLASEPLEIIF